MILILQQELKMPPKDPFNSMLSFGYSLLIYEIQNLILSKGLNPYIVLAVFYYCFQIKVKVERKCIYVPIMM